MNPLFVPTNWNKYNIYVIAHKLWPLGWRFKESIATGEVDRFNVPTYTFIFTSNVHEFSGYTLKFTQVYDKMHTGWDISLVQNVASSSSDDSNNEVTNPDSNNNNDNNTENKNEENDNSSEPTDDTTNE